MTVVRILLLLMLIGGAVSGQSPTRAPQSQSTVDQALANYERLLRDWAGLTRYGSDDSELGPPKPGERRVVFLGDQITEYWHKGTGLFSNATYLNRGIDGQTTAQMLVRFRQDVIALQPQTVIIEGGTNDIAGAGGPATKATVMDNIMSMADLAKANSIRVVLASITPVCDCFIDQTSRRSQVKIADINDALKTYAAGAGAGYLDFYSALAEGRDFKRSLTVNGLLPNEAGYRVMTTLVEETLRSK